MSVRILTGDCRTMLATLPDASVQCCVTSPPYFGLRDYCVDGQIGLEKTPDAYVAEMVAVFRDVRRVLRSNGVCWLNLGDSYAPNWSSQREKGGGGLKTDDNRERWTRLPGIAPKQLLMIPARVALALQADGWWLRSDVIWHKPNPMPESVTDRPTSAHEHVFLLTKRATYFYDAEAVAEPSEMKQQNRFTERSAHPKGDSGRQAHTQPPNWTGGPDAVRNLRNVWTIATQPYSGAHFATMPPELAERCIKAGTKQGDTVLDPFGGAGTTALAADRLGRDAILIELNPTYADLARERIRNDCPMFSSVA